MISTRIASAVVVFLGAPALAAGQQRECTLAIRGTTSVTTSRSITVSSVAGRSDPCVDSPVAGEICRATIPCEAKDAVLTVVAPNFKKYRRNIPALAFQAGASAVDLGQIRLQPSELPSVAQVIRSATSAQTVAFRVVLKNPLKREVFVRAVKVSAEREGRNVSCAVGGKATFVLNDKIQLEASAGQVLATGSFQETTRGVGFDVAANGTASVNLCGGHATLSLELPTAFTIPASAYSAVDFILPSRFNVRIVRSSRPGAEAYAAVLSSASAYDNYVFAFTTDREEELEIVARYSGGRVVR